MADVEVGVGEQGPAGQALDVDTVPIGGVAHESGRAGGLGEEAGRHLVVVEDPCALGMLLAAVEHLMGAGVAPLAVEGVEQGTRRR